MANGNNNTRHSSVKFNATASCKRITGNNVANNAIHDDAAATTVTIPPAKKNGAANGDVVVVGVIGSTTTTCPRAKAKSVSCSSSSAPTNVNDEPTEVIAASAAAAPPPPRVVLREVCDHVQFLITEKQKPVTEGAAEDDSVVGGAYEKTTNLNDGDEQDELVTGKWFPRKQHYWRISCEY